MSSTLIVGSVAVVVAIAVASALLLAARRRYAALLAAVELCQRQLTELRTVADTERSTLEGVATLLSESLAPRLDRLERSRALEQAVRELRQAAAVGAVDGAAIGALVEQLERLDTELLAADRGY